MAARVEREYRLRTERVFFATGLGFALLVLVLLASLALGPTGFVSPLALLEGDLVSLIRAYRTLAGLLAGIALGVVGYALQGVLRNPLVDPYILGVSSGAFLGGIIYTALGLPLGPGGLLASGFAGGLAALLLTYVLSRSSGFGVVSIVLSGVVVGIMFASMAALLIFVFEDRLGPVAALMFGSLGYAGPRSLWLVAPGSAVSLTWVVYRRRWFQHYLVGEDYAASRGVDVNRLKKEVFIITALGVGAVSAALGPIGFVGLIAPHLSRLATGGDPGAGLVLTIAVAPLILIGGDLAARSLLAPAEVPVGVFTSLVGAPFFLYLLYKSGGAGRSGS